MQFPNLKSAFSRERHYAIEAIPDLLSFALADTDNITHGQVHCQDNI
jgi:hypothetical protein